MRIILFFALASLSMSLGSAQSSGWIGKSVVRIEKPASNDSSSNKLDFRLQDKCDPVSFNAALGMGTCVGSGNVVFSEFIAELTEDKTVGAWRISPNQTDAKLNQMVVLENRGGETHTFTQVAKFGGGFIPPLNILSGNTTVAPECLAAAGPSNVFIPAGAMVAGPMLMKAGEQKFQCCVHPWMRATVKVEAAKQDK